MFFGEMWYGKGNMSETPTPPPQPSEQYQIPKPLGPQENDPDFGNSFVGHSISEEARRAREFVERTGGAKPTVVPQSETAKSTPDKKPLGKGAKIGIAAAGTVAGAALVAQGIGGLLPPSEQSPQPEIAPAVETFVQSSYDPDAYVGSFEITPGIALIDQAEETIKASVGEQAWRDARAGKYGPLLDSAKAVNALFPLPGTKTYVVELDIDHNQDNGNEFIVTLGEPRPATTANGTIPSPEQKTSNTPDLSNGTSSQNALIDEHRPAAPQPNE